MTIFTSPLRCIDTGICLGEGCLCVVRHSIAIPVATFIIFTGYFERISLANLSFKASEQLDPKQSYEPRYPCKYTAKPDINQYWSRSFQSLHGVHHCMAILRDTFIIFTWPIHGIRLPILAFEASEQLDPNQSYKPRNVRKNYSDENGGGFFRLCLGNGDGGLCVQRSMPPRIPLLHGHSRRYFHNFHKAYTGDSSAHFDV